MRTHLRLLVALVGVLAMAACSDTPDLTNQDSGSNLTGPNFVIVEDGCIGDLVWNDLDMNGCQDEGEPPVEGVTVRAFNCNDDVEAGNDVTDANGYYAIMIPPGDYYIRIDLPGGYVLTMVDASCGGKGLDSDIDPSTGRSHCTTITEGEIEKRMDVGIYETEDDPLGCRMTGGGVDLNGNWDGTFEKGHDPNRDRYQFGGQAGANTALPPQPKGEWTHHQQRGPSGAFVFHAGTASAPDGTEIDEIICSDPGFCNPARPAPAKQLDFWGVGTFKNMKGAPAIIENAVDIGTSLHWFEVNVDDAGEPGRSGKKSTANCPDDGYGLHGGEALVDCDCFDFYRITIYAGDTDASAIIYQVYGYIQGGNLQIHPLTGFDTN